MDEWDDYRKPYSLTDDIGSTIGGSLFSMLFFGAISAILGVLGFLLKRIDILNSIFISCLPIMLTLNNGWERNIYLGIFIASVIVMVILQHSFIIIRVLCSIFGCLTVLFFSYEFRLHAPRKEQIITMVIAGVIYALLNLSYWSSKSN